MLCCPVLERSPVAAALCNPGLGRAPPSVVLERGLLPLQTLLSLPLLQSAHGRSRQTAVGEAGGSRRCEQGRVGMSARNTWRAGGVNVAHTPVCLCLALFPKFVSSHLALTRRSGRPDNPARAARHRARPAPFLRPWDGRSCRRQPAVKPSDPGERQGGPCCLPPPPPPPPPAACSLPHHAVPSHP